MSKAFVRTLPSCWLPRLRCTASRVRPLSTVTPQHQHCLVVRWSFYSRSSPRISSCSYSTTPPSSPKLKVVSKELVVSPDESGMRLDRFLLSRLSKDHSSINHINIQKWLRKRQIKRVAPVQDQAEGKRGEEEGKTKAVTVTTGATRTETGQIWRIRLLEAAEQRVGAETVAEESDTSLPLQDWIVYKDDRIIVLNKPAGVAVQGGTGVQSSIDSSLAGKNIFFFLFDTRLDPCEM